MFEVEYANLLYGYELIEYCNWYSDDPIACCYIGDRYINGDRVVKSYTNARDYYRKAQYLGSIEAHKKLFEFGRFDYLFEMAKEGDAESQYTMYRCHTNGELETNYKLAVQYLKQSADQKFPPALVDLALYYRNGFNQDGCYIEKNEDEAFRLMQQADSMRYIPAHYYLGTFMLDGTGTAKNVDKGLSYIKFSAYLGYRIAQKKLGDFYLKGEYFDCNPLLAAEWYEKSVEGAFFTPPYLYEIIGDCYYNHAESEEQRAKAFNWYKKVIKNHDDDDDDYSYPSDSLFLNLGECYLYGIGTDKNYKKAVRLLTESANKGNEKALYQLGCCYKNGNGVEKDTKKAIDYFNKAAAKGYRSAKEELSKLENTVNGISRGKTDLNSRFLCKVIYSDYTRELFSLIITDNKNLEDFDADPAIVYKEAPIAAAIINSIITNKTNFECNGRYYNLKNVIKSNKFDAQISNQRLANTPKRTVDFTSINSIQRIHIYKARYKCSRCQRLRVDMNIESVKAKLFTITGKIVYIDLAYCNNCKEYFTDESTLSHFENKHGILAIEKIEEYDSDVRYKKDSILSRYGYKADGSMSDAERKKCITFIIENNLGDKYEIIHHLNFLLNERGYRLPKAAERWKSDLEFVHNYDLMKQRYVGNIFIIGNKPYLVKNK